MKTHLIVHETRTATGAVCVLALLAAASAQSQNLFVSDGHQNSIYEFTPGGVKSTFAAGLNQPAGLAFDRAGNLYEADSLGSVIYQFTPSGTRSTFASGLYEPFVLALITTGICLGATSARILQTRVSSTNLPRVEHRPPLRPG